MPFGSLQRHLRVIRTRGRMQREDEEIRSRNELSDMVREVREAGGPPAAEDAVADGPRPTRRAQWDEKQACWVEWDVRHEVWVRVG